MVSGKLLLALPPAFITPVIYVADLLPVIVVLLVTLLTLLLFLLLLLLLFNEDSFASFNKRHPSLRIRQFYSLSPRRQRPPGNRKTTSLCTFAIELAVEKFDKAAAPAVSLVTAEEAVTAL